MRIVNFSDARNSLRTVIDQVVSDADITVISRRDAPDAVVMSLDYYNSLMETVHLLSSPANAAHLARSIAQLRRGEATQRELIETETEVAVANIESILSEAQDSVATMKSMTISIGDAVMEISETANVELEKAKAMAKTLERQK